MKTRLTKKALAYIRREKERRGEREIQKGIWLY